MEANKASSSSADLQIILWNAGRGDAGVTSQQRQDATEHVFDHLVRARVQFGCLFMTDVAADDKQFEFMNINASRNAVVGFDFLPEKERFNPIKPRMLRKAELNKLLSSFLRKKMCQVEEQWNEDFEEMHWSDPRKRLDAVVLDDEVLLVSWCGTHNDVTQLEKQERFAEMLLYVDMLRQSLHCNCVIVGGNFNLSSNNARDILADKNTLHKLDASVIDDYQLPDDCKSGAKMDYIMSWPSGCIHSCVVSDLSEKETLTKWAPRRKGKRPFSHPIVEYRINLKEYHLPTDTWKHPNGSLVSRKLRLSLSDSPVRENGDVPPDTPTDDDVHAVFKEVYNYDPFNGHA